ncbi:hypothetical protein C8R46DRAFT_1115473 [Mycena filopes]|nr:hypothetical protein C8R46DRAFT_1115473 [Mycena filopes]
MAPQTLFSLLTLTALLGLASGKPTPTSKAASSVSASASAPAYTTYCSPPSQCHPYLAHQRQPLDAGRDLPPGADGARSAESRQPLPLLGAPYYCRRSLEPRQERLVLHRPTYPSPRPRPHRRPRRRGRPARFRTHRTPAMEHHLHDLPPERPRQQLHLRQLGPRTQLPPNRHAGVHIEREAQGARERDGGGGVYQGVGG